MDVAMYALVKRSVRKLLDINLDHYKDEQMRRRLDSWLVRSGAGSWPEYFRRAGAAAGELDRLRDYLTINVSAFFRDPERWQELREDIVPRLLAGHPRLRVWSAGCAAGPEPYSLAILLDELTPGRKHTLLATDVDRGALGRARARGPFAAQDLEHVSPAQRDRYFEADAAGVYVTSDLARRIQFREHDLITGDAETGYDLIVCRNVVIYFTAASKERIYRKFYDALRPGGMLFVGGTEIIPASLQIGFRTYRPSFYHKR
jgi:chemotaxis protein methyltransferase CheR